MPLRLYNTFTRKKEIFKPRKPKRTAIYTCGPTVYDYVHIGNLSSFLMADLIRRYLEYKGYKIKHIKNITDVGHLTEEEGLDKIEWRAIKEKKSPFDIARFYEQAFFEDEKKLNIKKADKYPRATEHIKEMIKLIEILLKSGYAYKTKSGVYFSVVKFKNYGKLSGNPPEKLMAGARVGIREEKKDPRDFALWIFDPKHLMQWQAPFGKGYPGWHIECSAMAVKYLRMPIDIHTGGEDNIFPHHECEIAQSESAFGKKFVNFWIHKRHLLVDGQKMSKSLGNYYILRDLEKMGFHPLIFRYLVLSAHYRTKLNFTKKSMEQAKEALDKIYEFVKNIKSKIKIKETPLPPKATDQKTKIFIKNLKIEFESALDDDLNTSGALAAIFDFMGKINPLIAQNRLSSFNAKSIYNLLLKLDLILGLELKKPKAVKPPKGLEKEILRLIKDREKARSKKNFNLADGIRRKLAKMGVEIRDTAAGTEWKMTFQR